MNKTGFNINDLHKVQYEILVEFDRVCKKYNLTYFLAYGTLLGAVRENGFIPWDDDIDTLMPYSDYIKLKTIDPKEWRNPYFLQSYDTDKEYNHCFMKLRNSNTTLITEEFADKDINHGVDIDIYPLIHLADSIKDRKKQYRYTMAYMLLRYDEPPVNHGKIYYLGGKVLLSIIPKKLKNKLLNRFKNQVIKYQKMNTRDSYVVNGNIEVMRQVLKTKWFLSSKSIRFENSIFPVPIGFHQWLSKRYGKNYIQPPPKELRGVKLDGFVKIDLSTPYIKYKNIDYCTKQSAHRRIRNNRWVNKT